MAGMPGVIFACRPVISVLFSRRRALSDYASVDKSALIFIAYAVLSFYIAIKEIKRNRTHFYSTLFLRTNLIIFILYCGLSFISMLWTVNIPLTGYRAFECVSNFLLIAVVVSKLQHSYGTQAMVEWVLEWYVCFDIFCRVLQCVPYWGIMLQLAQMTATVFFFLAIFHSNNHVIRIVIAVFSFFSKSTTSYIGMSVGTLGLLWGNKRMKLILIILVLVLMGAVLTWGGYHVLKNTVFINRVDIGMEYTSGRDKVWSVAFDAAYKRPWTGYGFFSGEPYILYQHFRGAINAHSSFCSALIGLGFPGFVLISLYIFSYLPILLGKNLSAKYRVALIGCYTVAVCHCIANPGIGSRVYGSWTSVVTLFLMINVIALTNEETKIARNSG